MAVASALAGESARWVHYFFKPATTFLVLARAWLASSPFDGGYRTRVAIALLFCAGGDILLMLPLTQGFVLGLASFLMGHLWFIAAATRGVRFASDPRPFGVYGAVAGAILAGLWPSIPQALEIPVIAYVVVLTGMAAQGAVRNRMRKDESSLWLAIGGACFLCSDSLLAWDRFAGPITLSRLWVLGSYYAAIWFIARSVSGSAAEER